MMTKPVPSKLSFTKYDTPPPIMQIGTIRKRRLLDVEFTLGVVDRPSELLVQPGTRGLPATRPAKAWLLIRRQSSVCQAKLLIARRRHRLAWHWVQPRERQGASNCAVPLSESSGTTEGTPADEGGEEPFGRSATS